MKTFPVFHFSKWPLVAYTYTTLEGTCNNKVCADMCNAQYCTAFIMIAIYDLEFTFPVLHFSKWPLVAYTYTTLEGTCNNKVCADMCNAQYCTAFIMIAIYDLEFTFPVLHFSKWPLVAYTYTTLEGTCNNKVCADMCNAQYCTAFIMIAIYDLEW